MNKLGITILIIGILIVGGVMYKNKQSGQEVSPTQEQTQDVASAGNGGKKIPFSSLMEQGGSYQCDVDQYIGEESYKGKVFMSDGQLRGTYVVATAQGTMDISFIVKDGYSYTWTNMMNTGFKTSARANEDINGRSNASGTYAWNADQIGDYNCEAWTPDASQFTLPKDKTFTEIKASASLN